jgi:hypothetical protein
LPDYRHQLSRILLSNSQPGVNQGAKSGVRDKPITGQVFFHFYSLVRTNQGAESAAFTRKGIDPEVLYRVKTAYILTLAATSAFFLIYVRGLPAPELGSLFLHGAEQKMKVGGIYVTIGKHFPLCKSRQ